MRRILLWFLVVTALVGCKSQSVTVAKETHSSDAVRVEFQHDSIWVRDSIWVDRAGDTVKVDKWHTETVWRVVRQSDTVRVRDSVPYEVQVVKEVRVRNGYDKATARGFWILLTIGTIFVVIWIGTKTKYGRAIIASIKALK